jgi:dihydroflavonol-4-reductase
MKVAVTGASGHIGINLIPELIKSGYEVRILSHRNEEILKKFNVPVVKGDLLEPDSLHRFIDGADVIIHLAAVVTIHKKSVEALKVNVQGTKDLLEAAKKASVRKFIYFSSIHSMDENPMNQVLDESRAYNTHSPFDYDHSKVVSEQMVLAANSEGFETIILNPTSVVGPMDYKPSLMGRAIIHLYNGRIPALLQGGYNWVDVRDVVKAALAAIPGSLPRQKFIIGGHWQSMTDLGTAVENSGGKPCPKLLAPFWMAYLGAGVLSCLPFIRKDDQLFTKASLHTLQNSHKNISSEKAKRILNFQPRPFDETIRDTVQWFKETKMID